MFQLKLLPCVRCYIPFKCIFRWCGIKSHWLLHLCYSMPLTCLCVSLDQPSFIFCNTLHSHPSLPTFNSTLYLSIPVSSLQSALFINFVSNPILQWNHNACLSSSLPSWVLLLLLHFLCPFIRARTNLARALSTPCVAGLTAASTTWMTLCFAENTSRPPTAAWVTTLPSSMPNVRECKLRFSSYHTNLAAIRLGTWLLVL